MTAAVPKAELHVHLEGTATPALVRKLAARHKLALPADLFTADDRFAWSDFLHFLKVYDAASAVIRTPEDYRDVTYDYLRRCAADGAIYVEVMSSPDHAAMAGMSYDDHLEGIAAGIRDAEADFAIVGRIVVTCVRHFGVERAEQVARSTQLSPHPLVTGFGMGGDEAGFPPAQFARTFAMAAEAGLHLTNHAGEAAGPESVWETLRHIPVERIGHGVRSAEDPALVRELADRGIVLEVCPTSNVATRVYPDYAAHPLRRLMEAGVRITLNSDDPPYFDTTIGREYAVASEHFAFTEAELREATRTALQAAFVDEPTRQRLLARLG